MFTEREYGEKNEQADGSRYPRKSPAHV